MLLVPKKALISDGNAVSVWTVRNGAAERVAIKRGRDLEAGVEVKQGLNDGDLVIIDPPADLKDGQKVAAKAG